MVHAIINTTYNHNIITIIACVYFVLYVCSICLWLVSSFVIITELMLLKLNRFIVTTFICLSFCCLSFTVFFFNFFFFLMYWLLFQYCMFQSLVMLQYSPLKLLSLSQLLYVFPYVVHCPGDVSSYKTCSVWCFLCSACLFAMHWSRSVLCFVLHTMSTSFLSFGNLTWLSQIFRLLSALPMITFSHLWLNSFL